jgi:hypothetical protein
MSDTEVVPRRPDRPDADPPLTPATSPRPKHYAVTGPASCDRSHNEVEQRCLADYDTALGISDVDGEVA